MMMIPRADNGSGTRTEGALNHLALFAFNWTRPRTNLSREREHQGRQGRVRDLSYFTAN